MNLSPDQIKWLERRRTALQSSVLEFFTFPENEMEKNETYNGSGEFEFSWKEANSDLVDIKIDRGYLTAEDLVEWKKNLIEIKRVLKNA